MGYTYAKCNWVSVIEDTTWTLEESDILGNSRGVHWHSLAGLSANFHITLPLLNRTTECIIYHVSNLFMVIIQAPTQRGGLRIWTVL
jgi:hypothetical protein